MANISFGLADITVNEDSLEKAFTEYKDALAEKRVFVVNEEWDFKYILPADNSRYFENGRKKIKARIRRKLGRFYNCPGMLVTLTLDQKNYTKAEAWYCIRKKTREWINRVNRWRRRCGWGKAWFLSVIEQHKSGYPHMHLVFPLLRFLVDIRWATQQWGEAVNSIDIDTRDSIAPVNYICKYITKMDGWSDISQAFTWLFRLRLYSISQRYIMPDLEVREKQGFRFYTMCTKEYGMEIAVKLLRQWIIHGPLPFDGMIEQLDYEEHKWFESKPVHQLPSEVDEVKQLTLLNWVSKK